MRAEEREREKKIEDQFVETKFSIAQATEKQLIGEIENREDLFCRKQNYRTMNEFSKTYSRRKMLAKTDFLTT